MTPLRILCLVLVVWPAAPARQTLTFTLTPQDFQKKKVKVKRTNLEYFSHYGPMLQDRNKPGRLESETIELPPGTIGLLLQWGRSLPPDGVTIKVQISADGRNWSHWFAATEEARLDRQTNLYFGQRVTGFGKARYVRYQAGIKAQPPPAVQGCLALINISVR